LQTQLYPKHARYISPFMPFDQGQILQCTNITVGIYKADLRQRQFCNTVT